MAERARPMQEVDKVKSTNWALYQLESTSLVVALGGGLMSFDLVNRDTYRAHRWIIKFGGGGLSLDVPYGDIIGMAAGKVSAADYAYFTTTKPVNFPDWDGAMGTMEYYDLVFVTLSQIIVYSGGLNVMAKISAANFQASIPGITAGGFVGHVHFASGKPVGEVDRVQKKEYDLPTPDEVTGIRLSETQTDGPILTYEFPADGLFEFGHYRIRYDATVTALKDVARLIKARPQNKRIYIMGYTDNVGRKDKNKTLSNWRAKTVMEYLQKEVGPDVVQNRTWVPVGYGWENPKVPNRGAANRQLNRRVVVKLLTEEAEAPPPPPY